MSRDDQAVNKPQRLVGTLPLHADLEPQHDGKWNLRSMAQSFTAADAQTAYQKARGWVSENPGQAAFCGVGAVSLAVFAAPALVSAPLLTMAGFGTKGVVANSAAAAAQAGIGNVVAPSLFATFTSAGMAGQGAVVVNGVVSAGAGITAAGSGGYLTMKQWYNGKEKMAGETATGRAPTGEQSSGNGLGGTGVCDGKVAERNISSV